MIFVRDKEPETHAEIYLQVYVKLRHSSTHASMHASTYSYLSFLYPRVSIVLSRIGQCHLFILLLGFLSIIHVLLRRHRCLVNTIRVTGPEQQYR